MWESDRDVDFNMSRVLMLGTSVKRTIQDFDNIVGRLLES